MQATPLNSAQTMAGTVPRESGSSATVRGQEAMPRQQVPQTAQSAEAKSPPAVPSSAEFQKALSEVQRKVQTLSPDIQFSVDESTGEPVVQMIDAKTKDLIRQIPSKEMLQISQDLERLQGLLVNKRA